MCWTVIKMIHLRLMLGAVISKVLGAGGPVEPELALDHAASKSGGNHIHGLGTLGDNGVIGESHGGGIVGLDERPPLGPFHFDEILI